MHAHVSPWSRLTAVLMVILGLHLALAPAARAEDEAVLLSNASSGGPPAQFDTLRGVGDTLYLFVQPSFSTRQLWQSDGTLAGTGPADFGAGLTGLSVPYAVGDSVLFFADSTSPGTSQLRALGATAGSSTLLEDDLTVDTTANGTALGVVGGQLLFLVRNTSNGTDLWRSDGTAAGTEFVETITPTGSASAYAATVAGDSLFFAAADGSGGFQLWKSDGTAGGTGVVKAVQPQPSYIGKMVAVADEVYFLADDAATGRELWKSDGTEVGTRIVRDIALGSADAFDPFVSLQAVNAGGTLFFFTDIAGDSSPDQLWKSDGTEAGTVRVTSKQLSSAVGGPTQLTALGSKAFFVAFGADTGLELWTSDGTDAGTDVLVDLFPGTAGSEPGGLTAIDRTLYFRAGGDSQVGFEVYSSDGTPEGTRLVADVASGSTSSNPQLFTAAGEHIFFIAEDDTNGRELWSLPRPEVPDFVVYMPYTVR
jgi:ELWxxDGT repeat protein